MFFKTREILVAKKRRKKIKGEKRQCFLIVLFFSHLNFSRILHSNSVENYSFRLAFSLYHMNGSVLQSRIYYENPKGRENRYFLNFSPNEKDTLFVANAEYKSNFLVQYPNHVYENFFKYLDTAYSKLDTQGTPD